jgi:hypothetical protein
MHQSRETTAVSRSWFIGLVLGAWATNLLVTASAAEPASALACANADLALIYQLAGEPHPSPLISTQLAMASMRMLDARSACRSGEYAAGIILYREADALTGTASV